MNIGGVICDAITPYDGVAYEVYVSGCTRACLGCHNPDMQDFSYGMPLNFQRLIKDMVQKEEWFDIISVVGGDLLCQDSYEAIEFMTDLYKWFPMKKFWLFTGEEKDNLPSWVFDFFDVIKYGPYKQELHQGGFPASSNQGIIRRGVDY